MSGKHCIVNTFEVPTSHGPCLGSRATLSFMFIDHGLSYSGHGYSANVSLFQTSTESNRLVGTVVYKAFRRPSAAAVVQKDTFAPKEVLPSRKFRVRVGGTVW